MSNLQRCMESLALCHQQEEPLWPAARTVAQQDIDAYLHEAGPALADRLQAMELLAAEFARRFPDEWDPVLIRSYMRRMERRIGYDLQQKSDHGADMQTVSQADGAPATVPEIVNDDIGTDDMVTENEGQMTDQQRLDIARLCHEANVPDRSGEPLSAEAAQQLIGELREKAAKALRS